MAGCDFGWVTPSVGGYCVGDGAGTVPKDLGDSAFDDIAESAAKAAGTTVKALGGAWMDLGTPDLTDDAGPVAFLQGSTLWFTSFTAVLCLLVAAGQLAWQRRSDAARQALQGMLNLVMVSSVGVATVALLTSAGDKFSVWIIDRSTGCRQISATGEPVAQCVGEFEKRTSAMLALGGADSSFLVLIMAVLVITGTVAQIALMIVRMAMLVILTGTLPLAAAASSTPAGRVWFRKSVGWLLAFVLYKPAAAVVYAAAFSLSGQKQDNEVVSMVSGVVLIVLACFTLPALMRFAAPVVQAAVSGTGRTAKASAGPGGPGAAATGALPVPHLRSLATGRSVAGAAVAGAAVSQEATGARAGSTTARGAVGAWGVPDGDRVTGAPSEPDSSAEERSEDRGETAARVPVLVRQYPDDHQEKAHDD
ncbi:type IV secretion system protein TrbL [Streptomyces ambofaciens]